MTTEAAKSTCDSRHKFKATMRADHPLNGKVFACELEENHEGNHTATVEGTKDQIHWTDAQELAA